MGSNNNLNRSFRHTQQTFDGLLRQYAEYGFTKNQILRAWDNCKQQPIQFHDELIRISNQDNQTSMTPDELLKSTHKLQAGLQKIEDENLKKAIQLSLEPAPALENLQDLLDQARNLMNVPVGLRNIGNTCYMNIMLQYMFATLPFRDLVLSLQIAEATSPALTVLVKLQELFALMQSGSRAHVSPQEFFEALQRFKPNTMLVKGLQNDYYELQVAFLDAIEDAIKELKDDSLLKIYQNIFFGMSEEILSYKEKDGEASRINKTTFGSINIDAKDRDLESGFAKTRLLLIDEYETDSGEKTKAKIEQNILQAPRVLSFYINRVYYDVKQKCAAKDNAEFRFPRQLNNEVSAPKTPEFQKILEEEQKCIDQLRHCGEEDEKELTDNFNKIIKLFKRSDGQIEQTLKVEDFLVCHNNTFNSEMIPSKDMLQQLILYRDSFIAHRTHLTKHFETLQERKKALLDAKKNVYTLTAVLMHDGSANSGHYYCYVLDRKDLNTWWKCNDRVITKVDYTSVVVDATGQNRVNANVSGLIYEQLEATPEPVLSKKLQDFVSADREKLLVSVDKLKLMNQRNKIQYMVQSYRSGLTYRSTDPFLQALEVYENFELFVKSKLPVLQYYKCVQFCKQEIKELNLSFPAREDEYIRYYMSTVGCYSKPVEQAYLIELQQFEKTRSYLQLMNISNKVNEENIVSLLQTIQGACHQFNMIEVNLFNAFKLLFQALLLKGCFLADLLIQKGQDKQAAIVGQSILKYTKQSDFVSPMTAKQIQENLKTTIEQMEIKHSPKESIDKFRQLGQVQTQSVVMSSNQPVGISEQIRKFRDILKNTEVWLQFAVTIDKTNKLIDQKDRLNKEMLLYFD